MQIADIRERDGNLSRRSRPGLLRRPNLVHQDADTGMPVEKMVPVRAESELHAALLRIKVALPCSAWVEGLQAACLQRSYVSNAAPAGLLAQPLKECCWTVSGQPCAESPTPRIRTRNPQAR